MRIGAAEINSTFTSQAEALAGILVAAGVTPKAEVVASEYASTENAQKLFEHDVDYGFMACNWIGMAARGAPPFTQSIDLRIVAPMNVGPMYFIARHDRDIASIEDLRGRRVAVGPDRSGTRQHAVSILGAVGIGFEDFEPVFLSFAEGAEALRRGDIDAQLQCPYPNAVIERLDRDFEFRVIGLTESEFSKVQARSPVYRRALMKSGSLRALKADALQAGVLNVLVSRADAPDEGVAAVAGTIADHAGELARRNPLFLGLEGLFEQLRQAGEAELQFDGVSLHPGARKAFRQRGLLE